MRKIDKADLLARHFLFRGLEAGLIQRLVELSVTRRLARDAVLFRKGDEGGALYGVLQGAVRIAVGGPDGREIVLNVMEPGDVFGEIALLDGLPRTADASAIVESSSVIGLRGSRAPSWHRLRGWSSGRGHSSVRGRRVRPPQVGVRRGPGASISESAWSPVERARARPVTAEGSSMSPLPRVPAGRFRRSGTRDLTEAAERLFCGPWSRGNPGRRSDARRDASGGAGVKAGEAPGLTGLGLDARASRCPVIIGSMPRFDLLRPRHRLAHPARAANGSPCRPATSGA